MGGTVELVQSERDQAAEVEAWRLHVLLQAGYPLRVAERLAKSRADLHVAVEILDRGCTPHMAARILV
ncbi:MAG TPA: hypothetical protein VFQ71_04420 [Gaiellales bacterium]|jgi:hypothetical protein|nr:hypothetical protein [Gaiellales bacterium]